jgi:hypothetical protein
VIVMTNLLVRGLSDAAVERIDAEASALGLSRNEFLRRKLEGATAGPAATLTAADWARSAATFGDMADSDVMAAAWR